MPALLLRTPDPLGGESIMGYLLRVSEMNGYDSPWHVLKHAGYSQDQLLKASFCVKKLAAILGKDPVLLASHGYQASPGVYQLNGHEIGRGLSSSPLRLRRPAICPQCIEEDKIAHVCWDLSAFTACPCHSINLVRSCSSCGRHLSWFRPGLLKCKCGASLAHEATVSSAPAITELMRVIRTIVMREQTPLAREGQLHTMPEQLTIMPLASLLRLIHVLNKLDMRPSGDEAVNPAAEALFCWPTGFHDYLRRMGSEGIAAGVKALTIHKQFKTLRSRLFKSRSIEGIEFINEEFIRFGLVAWGEILVDPRVANVEKSAARFLSGAEVASRLGVMPITAYRWIERGLLSGKQVRSARASRYVVEANSIEGVSRDFSERLEARQAGKFAGLPVSVLMALKRSGHYSPSPVVNMRTGFWPADLEALKGRILATAKVQSTKASVDIRESVITLGRILSVGKLGAPQLKGAFVAEVLDGLIVPCGAIGDSLHDLQFHAGDVEKFRVRYSLTSPSEFLSASAAAQIIGCRPHAIVGLASAGFIRRKPGKAASIARISAVEFAKQWRPLAAVAKELSASPQGLALRAAQRGITCLRIRLNPRQEALFLSRVDAERLCDICHVHGRAGASGAN